MKKIANLGLCLFLAFSSCKKDALKKEASALEGSWSLTAYSKKVTDLNGAVMSETSSATPGSLVFSRASGDQSDVFSEVTAEGQMAQSPFVVYFRTMSAGSRTASGGLTFYWDADPNGKRILLWAIGPTVSYHRVVNLEKAGDRQMTISYVEDDKSARTRSFYSWGFSK